MHKWWKRQAIPFISCPAQMKISKLRHRRTFALPKHYLDNKYLTMKKIFLPFIITSCLSTFACPPSTYRIYEEHKHAENPDLSATEIYILNSIRQDGGYKFLKKPLISSIMTKPL